MDYNIARKSVASDSGNKASQVARVRPRTAILGRYHTKEQKTLPPESAVALFELATDALKRSVLDEWVPLLIMQGEDAAEWDWEGKAEDPQHNNGVEHVYLVAEGKAQGVLITSLPETPRPQEPEVLYVEYIASAPWNRESSPDGMRFGGIGSILLLEAIERSIEAGRHGCIGLNSVDDPKTLKWYREKIKMKEIGPDASSEGMIYFLGDAEWSTGFMVARKSR